MPSTRNALHSFENQKQAQKNRFLIIFWLFFCFFVDLKDHEGAMIRTKAINLAVLGGKARRDML